MVLLSIHSDGDFALRRHRWSSICFNRACLPAFTCSRKQSRQQCSYQIEHSRVLVRKRISGVQAGNVVSCKASLANLKKMQCAASQRFTSEDIYSNVPVLLSNLSEVLKSIIRIVDTYLCYKQSVWRHLALIIKACNALERIIQEVSCQLLSLSQFTLNAIHFLHIYSTMYTNSISILDATRTQLCFVVYQVFTLDL